MVAIVDIDVYKSTMLKAGKPQIVIDEIFGGYHELVGKTFDGFSGRSWHEMGDGAIYLFQTSNKAVDACLQLLQDLVEFNRQHEDQLSHSPLFVRIGIHATDLEDIEKIPEAERGRVANTALDISGKLQKNCPIGKMAISVNVYEGLGLQQRLFRPALTEYHDRQFFVLVDRLITPQEERSLHGLTRKQKVALPPIPFLGWDTVVPDNNVSLRRLDEFFANPLLVILGETSSKPKGPMSSAATSDAVGMMEVMAALKAHQQVRVGIDQWEDTADIVWDRNIVVIGSGIVNVYAFALNDVFHPVHFVKTGGRVFDQIVATSNKGQVYFGSHATRPTDSGLVIVSRSPFNLEKSLLWVAGITGMGTQAVANFLKDLVVDAGSILRKIGIPESAQPVACIVGAETRGSRGEWKLSDYHGRWRISDYRVSWMVDQNENKIL